MSRIPITILCSFVIVSGIGVGVADLSQADTNPVATTEQSSADRAISQKVDALMAKMSLDEKIGQMVLFTHSGSITGPTGQQENLADEVRTGNCGGIFNAHTVKTIRAFQKIAVEQTRLKIPLIFGNDVIHGYKTIFPIPLAQASSWDTNAIETSTRIAATEATAGGVNWTFAPMVDIARDPRWGRIAEGAGEDPYLGSQIAAAQVRGFQGTGLGSPSNLLACAKHFAAYGAVQAGRDYFTVDMSERTLREVYLPPYKAAIDAGALSVMCAFIDLNGVPATANPFLLKQILRDEWGFKGFVVSDYHAINELVDHGFATDEYDAAKEALDAGVDMDMQGGAYLNNLKKAVANGDISQDQIDDAVKRILTVKFKLGLFDDPFRYCDENRETNLQFTAGNLEAAYNVACESMVLLKNTNQTLPFKPGLKIAVIGPLAQSTRDLLGSWAARGDSDKVESVLSCIARDNVGGQTLCEKGCDVSSMDKSGFPKALKIAKRADFVVMVLGESANMSGEAESRTSISLPGVQTELLEEIKKTGRKIVVVLLNGRPLTLGEESGIADAMLEAWQPGTEGGKAIADVLFGKHNPSAKLPVTFPRNVGQVPIYYSEKNSGRPFDPANPSAKYKSTYLDSPNDPLYPFGFGLSYTKFAYSDIQLSKNSMTPDDQITVTVKVSNVGNFDGAEIVQLYIRDMVGSVTRPVLELKGFQRIDLKAGDSRDVSFTIGRKELTFLRRDMAWGTEPGKYKAFVGPSSGDLQSADFELEKQ
jgi:beta-glucosidase